MLAKRLAEDPDNQVLLVEAGGKAQRWFDFGIPSQLTYTRLSLGAIRSNIVSWADASCGVSDVKQIAKQKARMIVDDARSEMVVSEKRILE